MNTSVIINTAFPLPAPDVEALLQGQTIAAMPGIFVNPGRQFALYPCDTFTNALPTEQYYRSNFLRMAQQSLAELDSETVLIRAWARCELCQILDDADSVELLSRLTVWTKEALQQTFKKRGYIFLAYLRVYRLPQPLEIPTVANARFMPLPQPLTVTETTPVFGRVFFEQRSRQMKERQLPPLCKFEWLHREIVPLADTNFAAKELAQEIKSFLGWVSPQPLQRVDSDLIWIETIAKVGNSGDAQEFNKLVRQGLLKLGFTNSNENRQASLESEGNLGTDTLDFYGEAPYPIVGKCQANFSENQLEEILLELPKLDYKHLQAKYDHCLRLIVAPGKLTPIALQTAKEHKISVIHPETLQSLVEMQAQHQGCIDLMKLKEYFQDTYGLIDEKVEQYLAEVRQNIKVRSHLVQLVKNYLHNAGLKDTAIDALHNTYSASSQTPQLSPQEMHEILVELSSPLTGYLGRIKGKNWQRDRFYFLRSLA